MKKNWTENIKSVLIHPYTWVMFILLIKIIAFQIVIFDNKSVFHILLVEFPMWALCLTVFIILFKKRKWLAIWLYNLGLSALFIVVIYYTRYFSTVPSYYDVKQIYQSNSVGGTIALLGTPYDYLFFLDVAVILPLIWYFKKGESYRFAIAKKWAIGFSCAGLITTIIAFFYPLVDVSYFAKKHGYVQSQFVQMYERSIGKAFAENENLSDEELAKLKGNSYVPFTEHQTFGLAKDRHVFVIQVESLQGFTINQSIDGQEITPNLNALLKESAYFDNVYQQIGAGNTSDAEWLMHTSLYPEGMDPTVNVIDEGSEIPSLVRTLKDNDYVTATYHADDITYWSRDKLYPVLGFDYIYTDKEIPSEKDIGFGPPDEVLFDFVESQLPKQLKTHDKIYSNIITLTNHTPFEMPEEYQFLDLPDEYEGTYVGNYLQSVRYSDEQIGLFIEQLKELGIYDDSILLIYGDHSGLHGAPVTEKDYEFLKEILGHDYNLSDRFILPVLFTAPGIFHGETHSQLGGQIDLMPTLLNLLGIEHNAQMIGHNLFQYKHNQLGMRYYMPGGSFISDKTLYTAPSAKHPAALYNRETMKKTKNTKDMQKKIDNTLQILEYSDFIRKEMGEE